MSDNNSSKKGAIGSGLYIALAVCILSLIGIGVYSAVYNVINDETAVIPPSQKQSQQLQQSQKAQPDTTTPNSNQQNSNIKNEPASSNVSGVKDNENKESENSEKTEETNAAKENANQNGQVLTSKEEPTAYHKPVSGVVSKSFSPDVLVWSQTMNDYRAHTGLDISAQEGSPVYAVSAGTIEDITNDPLMGKTIIISHDDGMKSTYMNLSAALPDYIDIGVSVQAGDIIAAVGNTSMIECAEESHLHFELEKDAVKLDAADHIILD